MKKLLVILAMLSMCSCGAKQDRAIQPQPTKLAVENTTVSESEFKASCKSVTFKELKENNAFEGENLTLTGEVVQKRKNADMYRFAVSQWSGGYTDVVLFTVDGDINFKEGDIIKVYGISEGMYTYTSSMNVEITAPLLR